MNTTTTPRAVDVQAIAQDLTHLLLSARASLPRALNNRGPVPSDPKAAQVRKDAGQSRIKPFLHELTVSLCDARDGAPLSEVLAPWRQAIAQIEAEAVVGHMHRTERPIPAIVQAETKAQFRLDRAQFKVVDDPSDPEALVEAIKAGDEHVAGIEDFTSACERQLAVVRGAPRPSYGRRPNLSVTR